MYIVSFRFTITYSFNVNLLYFFFLLLFKDQGLTCFTPNFFMIRLKLSALLIMLYAFENGLRTTTINNVKYPIYSYSKQLLVFHCLENVFY